MVPENILPPPWKVFWFEPPLPPMNFQFSFILSFKNFAFKTTLPLRISKYDLPWGGYGIFWNRTFCYWSLTLPCHVSYGIQHCGSLCRVNYLYTNKLGYKCLPLFTLCQNFWNNSKQTKIKKLSLERSPVNRIKVNPLNVHIFI